MSSQYNPKQHEDRTYTMWEESGVFHADNASTKEPFVISMPPPNATGELHVGHALFLTIQDIMIRHARMQGREALWLPGTDHAAIATESVVIRNLQKKEGIQDPRNELGREELIKRIKKYVKQSRGAIRAQIRKMGASCDWSREKYTLDQPLNRCVNEVFKKMYEDDIIYRGHRIVNWDPKLQTNVSDDEIEWQEEKIPFYTFKYGPFNISTARPETKFGDKYVVVHPDDERYKKYKDGETFTCEWINGKITATVIKDKHVDPNFGTGAMTITPWHDNADFEIAERHQLDKEQIIDFEGKLLPIAEEFAGMSIEQARPKIVQKLKEKGLLTNTDQEYVHNVALNDRGKGKIEPQIREQWFINVNKKAIQWNGTKKSIKEVMQEVVRKSEIEILPKRFEKLYFHWIDNLRDWCISRQIWWGHRIPVWYKGKEIYVGAKAPEGKGWEQDHDTLDTWFSSGLWTWSTLVDPNLTQNFDLTLQEILEQSPDYKAFHPTQVMETGYDIIFFWIARMILMTTYATGQIPFKTVFLHGLVTTTGGKKMSKSDPSKTIDPLDMIEKYGTDATRFGLISKMNYGNQTVPFDEHAVRTGRNFANKLWNISRLLASLEKRDNNKETIADIWIAQQADKVTERVSQYINEYKFGEAARTLYDFIWKDVADWYIEIVKTEGSIKKAQEIFKKTLQLLHPFMPYVTEVLWEQTNNKEMLITNKWPITQKQEKTEAAKQIRHFQNLVNTIRSARTLLDIRPAAMISIQPEKQTPLTASLEALCKAKVTQAKETNAVTFILPNGSYVKISSDEITKESKANARNKLHKEQQELNQFTNQQNIKLENMKDKAPQEKIKAIQEARNKAENRLKEIESILSLLS